MPAVIGIRFKDCGKIYDFEANGSGTEFKKRDCVVVESDLGLSIGSVIIERRTVETSARELRKVLRKATEEDFKQKQDNEAFEKEAKDYCIERIMARGLPMKLVFTESTLDKKRIVFYFTADGRIDFRELVKDLAARFKTRIEMRQIGVRDKAKLVGGLGICGKELCCRLFLTSFEPISIKMAKQQDLTLNTGKLSGTCGRLMCCLGYEYNETSGPGGRSRKSADVAQKAAAPEIVEEPADRISPEIVCCPAELKPENIQPEAGTKGEQQKTEGAPPQKKRRRRRHR